MIVLPQSNSRCPVRRRAFPPAGLTPACAVGKGEGVALWDLIARECGLTLRQDGKIASVAFAPNGKLLASATSGGSLCVWSLKAPCRLVRQEKWTRDSTQTPGHVVFAPDSGTVAATA